MDLTRGRVLGKAGTGACKSEIAAAGCLQGCIRLRSVTWGGH